MHPPPGYPFEGPLPSRPPPARGLKGGAEGGATSGEEAGSRRGRDVLSAVSWAGFFVGFVALMTGIGFLIVALVVTRARAVAAAAEISPASDVRRDSDDSFHDGTRTVESPAAMVPTGPRQVPTHPVRFLEGCSDADLQQVEDAIGEAVTIGAPLYNDGDVVGCYETYDTHARDLEKTLPVACRGPAEALAGGRRSAAGKDSASARAWAMRDAFDGLLEVIDRSRSSGVGNL
jgi:hypothetical protein